MAIVGVSQYSPAELAMLKQVFHDPLQKESIHEIAEQPGFESRVTIIADPERDPLCFKIHWKMQDGSFLQAPFWADAATGKWCCLNGNPHIFSQLPEVISEILKHLSQGEAMRPKPMQNRV